MRPEVGKRPSTQGTPFSTNYTQKDDSMMLIKEQPDNSRNVSSAFNTSKFNSGKHSDVLNKGRKISRVH